MKLISKLLGLGLLISLLLSCSDDTLDAINENPNEPTDVPIAALLPQATVSTIAGVAGDGAGEYAPYFVEHTANVHPNVRRPELVNDDVWNSTYNTLMDLQTIIEKGSEGGDEEGFYSAVGVAKVLYAYALSVGTDFFGEMPHSEALQGSVNRAPAFDEQETIYAFLQQRLDEAIADLNRESAVGDLAQIDLVYQGDTELWIKTAYALKARLYNRLSNVDPEQSARNALDAINQSFTSPEENFVFEGYLTGLTNDNPWAAVQKSQQTYAVGTTFIELMDSFTEPDFTDPRAERWFTTIEGEFVGAPPGEALTDQEHVLYSAPSDEVLYDAAPQPLLTYDELKFIEAEAQLRLGNAADAYAAYQEAVRAALARAEVAEEDAGAYVNQSTVFPGADGLTLEHIIGQKNISFWLFQSIEAYNDYRRTGIPNTLSDPRGTPLRLAYPPSEINRNSNAPDNINDVTIYEIPVWWAS